jgi:hypothetical protein
MNKKCRAGSKRQTGPATGGSRGATGASDAPADPIPGPCNPEQSPALPVRGGGRKLGGRGVLPKRGRVQGAGQDAGNQPDDSRQAGPRARTRQNPEPEPCSSCSFRKPAPAHRSRRSLPHRSPVRGLTGWSGAGLRVADCVTSVTLGFLPNLLARLVDGLHRSRCRRAKGPAQNPKGCHP